LNSFASSLFVSYAGDCSFTAINVDVSLVPSGCNVSVLCPNNYTGGLVADLNQATSWACDASAGGWTPSNIPATLSTSPCVPISCTFPFPTETCTNSPFYVRFNASNYGSPIYSVFSAPSTVIPIGGHVCFLSDYYNDCSTLCSNVTSCAQLAVSGGNTSCLDSYCAFENAPEFACVGGSFFTVQGANLDDYTCSD
jgi:hypothetical protein